MAVEDRLVLAALRFIRAHAGEPISSADVVRAVPASRRRVEMAFRTQLGRTILSEIRRVRLARARELLEDTQWKIDQVASAAGFREPARLHELFRKTVGMTPAEYRRQTWPP